MEVEQWLASGQSAKEYADQQGILATTLTYWASRLGLSRKHPRGKGGATGGSRARGRQRGKTPSRGFLPVSVVTPGAQHDGTSVSTSTPRMTAELELGGGRRLRLSGLENLGQLAELVADLEERLAC